MAEVLHSFCIKVYATLIPPDKWITNAIIPLPKKGDLSLMTNYRGISLMSIAAKVYNKILLNRIRSHIDPILRKNQAGFRKGRSCAQQTHILRRIMEGFQSKQLPLCVTLQISKRPLILLMFAVLRHYGIPEKAINAISVLYKNSKNVVSVDGNISESFNMTTGVLQGDVLAPFLFGNACFNQAQTLQVFLCDHPSLWLQVLGDFQGYGKQDQFICHVMLPYGSVYKMTKTRPLIKQV